MWTFVAALVVAVACVPPGDAESSGRPTIGVVLAPSASQEAKFLVQFLLVGSSLGVGRLESGFTSDSYEGVDALVLVHDAMTPAMLESMGSCGQAGLAAGVVHHSEGGLVAALGSGVPPALMLAFGGGRALNSTNTATPRLGTIVVAAATLSGLRAAIGEFVRRAAVAAVLPQSPGVEPEAFKLGADSSTAAMTMQSLCVLHTPPPWFHMVRSRPLACGLLLIPGCCRSLGACDTHPSYVLKLFQVVELLEY